MGSSKTGRRNASADIAPIDNSKPPIYNQTDFSSLKTEEEWLTTKEAAAYLKIPVSTLWTLSSNGKVPYYKLGRSNRYAVADLRNLLLSQKRGGFYGN